MTSQELEVYHSPGEFERKEWLDRKTKWFGAPVSLPEMLHFQEQLNFYSDNNTSNKNKKKQICGKQLILIFFNQYCIMND